MQSYGSLVNLSVSNSLQPTTNSLLNLDTGCTKLIRPELLQICDLPGSEEDLCLTKLEHVWLLRQEIKDFISFWSKCRLIMSIDTY